jgi:hypothetical protein
MSTIVKNVESESIVLDDCEIKELSSVSILILLIISVIAGGIFVFLSPPSDEHIVYPLAVLGIILATWCGSMIIMNAFTAPVPGYSIWIVGDYKLEMRVIKTTPEQDQKEVCKIVQELEPICREKSKKKRELDRIAQGCK